MNIRTEKCAPRLRGVAMGALVAMAILWRPMAAHAEVRIVAIGDSIVLGSGTSFAGGRGGVSMSQAWPAVLERMLRSQGWNVTVVNQGVNGEESSGTLARVGSAVPVGTDLTVVMVGGKDMLNHVSHETLRSNLKAIAEAIRARGSAVLIEYPKATEGMRDPVTHYAIAEYDSGDHEHFNAAGNELIASRILSEAERELRKRGLEPGK